VLRTINAMSAITTTRSITVAMPRRKRFGYISMPPSFWDEPLAKVARPLLFLLQRACRF
jgi:hypothetical protein